MGKQVNIKGGNTNNHSGKDVKILPFVSVCTPTFNRRPFIKTMFDCFKHQTYPKHRMEWIIVDDGTDKINDLIASANIPQIKYFAVDQKMTLGAKRNFMHEKTKGSILVYMDDDDYYPPERVEHAVDRLTQNKSALCAGSSELYVYFKHIGKMIQCGPYGPNHATAGTFAFRKELLLQTRYEDHAALAEEKAFLKEYTIPFVQLDPLKTILVFSHEHNTFDKRKLLENAHPQYIKESPKTVSDFIRRSNEADIHDFFMNRIDGLLKVYDAGEPKWKPEVLEQIKEIDKKRAEMMREAQMKAAQGQGQGSPAGTFPQIMMERPGEEPRALTAQEIVDCMKQQQDLAKRQSERIVELENIVVTLQRQLMEKTRSNNDTITVANDKDKMIETVFSGPTVSFREQTP
jgi:glycosyltransferase involved in cell wall biosynthesis